MSKFGAWISAMVLQVWKAREDRTVDPDGSFDNAGRWYPSEIEDADGDGSKTRSPSRAWPYSYLLRCRTRQHCRVLVERALQGEAVSSDVGKIVTMHVTSFQREREEIEMGRARESSKPRLRTFKKHNVKMTDEEFARWAGKNLIQKEEAIQ